MTADLIDEFLSDAASARHTIELGTREELRSIAQEMRRRAQRCKGEAPVAAVPASLAPPWEEGTFPAVLPAWCGTVETTGIKKHAKRGR